MKPTPIRYQTDDFTIRAAADAKDCKDSEDLQLRIWGFPEMEVVPVHMLRALSSEGGLVMNAYDNNDSPIGTSFAFLAKHAGKLILYSHITGVLPEFQGKGVGLALKLMQRKYAIQQRLDLVCWTYDPMQSLNNWFNLNKLGAIARNYYVNYYGNMPDDLNRGVETDRFLAEWWVKSRRVNGIVKSGKESGPNHTQKATIVNPSTVKEEVRIPSGQSDLDSKEKTILIEIPHKYEDFRKLDASVLQQWRSQTRQLYMHYFKRGYIATKSFVDKSDGKRSFVKLERGPLKRILMN
jgi:predicted GNAT superfamily acetyltransferase